MQQFGHTKRPRSDDADAGPSRWLPAGGSASKSPRTALATAEVKASGVAQFGFAFGGGAVAFSFAAHNKRKREAGGDGVGDGGAEQWLPSKGARGDSCWPL